MYIQLFSSTEREIKNEVAALSREHPGEYFVVVNDFGYMAMGYGKTLHRLAPSDSVFSWYCINGAAKDFTGAQKTVAVNVNSTNDK